jgi:ACS family glucarate transporter-like MFS transporter
VKKRHGVLVLLGAVSIVTFLDRLAIAVTGPGVQHDLRLTPVQWGLVLSSYVIANTIFEIPSGALGDRYGQRGELTRIAAWWSIFTALTGWCRTFWQLFATRFLFGVGAAGAYPNAAGVIPHWFPRQERARSQGVVWAASRLGAALAPLTLVPIQLRLGWRAVFVLLGGLGLVWAVVWRMWFHDRPATQPGITERELEEIGETSGALHRSVPWRKLLALRQLWLIVAAYGFYGWASWFYFSWFPTWMVNGAHISLAKMGIVASFPFLLGVAGNLAGGYLSDRLVERYGMRVAYRRVTSGCLLVASGLFILLGMVHGAVAVVVTFTLCFGVMDLMLPAAWAMCLNLGGSCGGTATAVMNTAGNLGGLLCTVVFGYAIRATGNYNLPLFGIAAVVLLSAILFSQVDCTHGLHSPDDATLAGG